MERNLAIIGRPSVRSSATWKGMRPAGWTNRSMKTLSGDYAAADKVPPGWRALPLATAGPH